MVTLRMGKDARALCHPAGFRIARPIVKPCNPGGGHRAGAHRAGLERDVKIMARQALASRCGTGGAQREDFRMRCRVVQFARAIARLRHDPPLWVNHHGPHRHLAAQGRGARLLQRCHHMAFECHGASLPRHHHFRKPRE